MELKLIIDLAEKRRKIHPSFYKVSYTKRSCLRESWRVRMDPEHLRN